MELLDKQGILDALGGKNTPSQTQLMDKAQILQHLQSKPSAPVGDPAKPDLSHSSASSLTPQQTTQQTPQAKEESTGWFQKGAMGDSDKNFWQKLGATVAATDIDKSESVVSTLLGMPEKVLDTAMLLYGANTDRYNPIKPLRDRAEPVRQFWERLIEKDLYDENAMARALLGDRLKEKTGYDVDTDSVLGEKADALLGSLTQTGVSAGLNYVGVPWWVTTAATSLGGEAESALKEGATMEEATFYAAVATGAELLTEKLFGGSGMGEKGLVNLDKFTKGVSNKVVKALLDYGIDMSAEGFEEILSTVMSNLATSIYREENPIDLLVSGEAFDGWLDALIGGMVSGGLMNAPKVAGSVATQTDYRTGLTAEEQKVFDKQFDEAVKQAETDGKLTPKKRRELYDATMDSVLAQRPATPTQSEEAVQAEKVPTQEESAVGGQQTAQTAPQITEGNQQTMTPQQAMQETIAEIIGVPSVTQAVESFRQNGKVSNSQAESIIADDGLFREILEMTGIAPPTTKSESRAAVKQAVAKLAQETVSDNAKIASESTGADATIAETTIPAESTPNPNDSLGAAPAGFSGDGVYEEKTSKVITNTMANATDESFRKSGEEALKADPDIGTYYVSKEKDSVRFAQARTQTPEMVEQEYNYLMENGINSAEDVDTAKIVQTKLFEAGDTKRYTDIVKLTAGTGTRSGQIIQAFAKYTRMSGQDAAAEAVLELDALKPKDVPKRFYKDGGFEQWKSDVITSAMNIAKQIDAVSDGDVEGMKDIIRSLAKFRKTTAWFGISSNLAKVAEAAMDDISFTDAKAIANAQLGTFPGDFKKRPVGQVVKTIRIHNMLSSLTTTARNLDGNAVTGVMEATSDSTAGRMFDTWVSKYTGKRTVGNDIRYAKEYLIGAAKATKMAALCAELDIPMDSESRFTTGPTRTYSPQGGPVMRFLSAYEKYMKYSLEVTDKFFEGGSNAAVDKSLEKFYLQGKITEQEMDDVSRLAAQRRTFKDERMITRASKYIRRGLNEVGTENIGFGDLAMPFASIGSTAGHVAMDYTTGAITGAAQVFKLIHDVKHGKYENGVKTISKNGVPVRSVTLAEAQRAAVTNMGRGFTGIPVIATCVWLAVSGCLKIYNDDDSDKRGLEQSQNLSGAQINVSAALRGLSGKDTEWKDDDAVISIDFLEPFNAQLYLGYMLSQDESVLDAIKNYPAHAAKSVISSIVEMPAMQSLQEIVDMATELKSLEDDDDFGQWAKDSAGELLGSAVSSFIPNWVRQTAHVIDPYYRDTSGETSAQAAVNQILAAIPFASQTLPKKYSGLGQEQRRYDDLISGIFNTMLNPGDADRLKMTEVTDFLDELYDQTGNLSIYPDATAPASFTQDGKKYTISTKEQTETYQKTYGDAVNRIYAEFMDIPEFRELDAADQVELLSNAKTAARELAKSKISGKYKPPTAIRDKPNSYTDGKALYDAYMKAKREKEKEAKKEAAKEEYWANKNGQ